MDMQQSGCAIFHDGILEFCGLSEIFCDEIVGYLIIWF
jgi:hypothetical protein